MNKIYNVVFSEEHGTWSELDNQGRKKSSRTKAGRLLMSAAMVGAGLTALPAAASTCATNLGGQSTVASGGSCDMGVYTAATNDNKVGQALVTGGDTVTLTSPDINNITGNANDRSIRSGKLSELFTEPAILAELNQRQRLLANQKGRTVNVTDPATNSNQTVNVYNNVGSISAADVQSTVSTGNDIYVDMRLGTANGNGSKIIANLGDPAATMADETTTKNTVKTLIALKNSRLVQAENGGSAEWVSKNRIYFEETRVASQEMAISQDLFKPKTVTFKGVSHTLNTVQDLINYNNNVLIPAVGTPGFANAGETQQAAYDRYFNEAAATETKVFRQNNPITIHPDSTLPIGERWVLAATGAGSTATIKNGGQIDVSPGLESGNGGGMLAENGGKAVIEEGAQLSGRFNSLTVRGAGSTAINNGVISGGFFASDNYDTTQAKQTNKNDYYSLSTTIHATNSGNFENNGIINLAGYTYQG